MNKIMLAMALVLSLVLVTVNGNVVKAEDEIMEEMDFSYGIVVSIAANNLVLREYNYDTEQEVDAIYVISAETMFMNVEGYSDIQTGDEVDVNYVVENGKKRARMISKEMDTEESGYQVYEEIEKASVY